MAGWTQTVPGMAASLCWRPLLTRWWPDLSFLGASLSCHGTEVMGLPKEVDQKGKTWKHLAGGKVTGGAWGGQKWHWQLAGQRGEH